MLEKLGLSPGEKALIDHIACMQCELYYDVRRCLITKELIKYFGNMEYEKAEKLEQELAPIIEKDFPFYKTMHSRFTILFEIKNTLANYVQDYTNDEYVLQGHNEPHFVEHVRKGLIPSVCISYSDLAEKIGSSVETAKNVIKRLEQRELLEKSRINFGPFCFKINKESVIDRFLKKTDNYYFPMYYTPWKISELDYLIDVFKPFTEMTVEQAEEKIGINYNADT